MEHSGDFPDLTADDWKDVAAAARRAGDIEGANAAEQYARSLSSSVGFAPQAAIVGTVAKKALKALLKHGIHKVPKRIRPYANKILNVLDQAEAWEIAGLTAAFSRVGIPPDVAAQAATWIVRIAG